MKKCLIAVIALLVSGVAVAGAVFLLGGDFYDQTQERLARPAAKIVLTVTLGEGEERLEGTYTTTFAGEKTQVEYTFEELALFEMQNGEYVVPSERKRTVAGKATVEDGKLVASKGKAPSLDANLLTLSALSFEEAYFENAVITDTTFEADVKNTDALIGLSEACKNVRIVLTFDEKCVRTLRLSFDTAQGEAAVLYFTFDY